MTQRWTDMDGPDVPLGAAPSGPGEGPQVEDGDRELSRARKSALTRG